MELKKLEQPGRWPKNSSRNVLSLINFRLNDEEYQRELSRAARVWREDISDALMGWLETWSYEYTPKEPPLIEDFSIRCRLAEQLKGIGISPDHFHDNGENLYKRLMDNWLYKKPLWRDPYYPYEKLSCEDLEDYTKDLIQEEPMSCFDYFYSIKRPQSPCVWSGLINSMDFRAFIEQVPPGTNYFACGGWPGEKRFCDHSMMSRDMLVAMINLVKDNDLGAFLFADIGIAINGLDLKQAVDLYKRHIKDGVTLQREMEDAIAAGIRERLLLESIRDAAMESVEFMEAVLGMTEEEYYERGFELSPPTPDLPYGAYCSFEVLWDVHKRGGLKNNPPSPREFCLMEMQKEVTRKIAKFHKPVMLMSQLVQKHPQINQNFEILAEIAEQDEVFCELAWNCIPEGARVNKIRQATGGNWGRKSYKKLSKEQKSIARQAMCYTLFQISFMVYWGGKKYSYKGEEPFDELAVYSLEKYSRRLHIASPLEFCYPDKGSEKTTESHVPYAHYAFGYSKKAAIALMKPEAFGSLEERLADSMEYDLRIFRHFLEKVNSRINLSGHQKRKLINLGILKMLKELLTELMTDDQFKFRVMELLNGEMTLDEWKSNDRFINFFNFLSPRFVTSIQCEIFFNNLSKTFCISKKIREDFDCLKDEEWATFDDGWHLDRVDFGSVVEMLSTLKPGQEDGISYIIRHIAKILSRVASKRPKIADYLDQFFEAVIPRICPNAELSFSSHQAQWH